MSDQINITGDDGGGRQVNQSVTVGSNSLKYRNATTGPQKSKERPKPERVTSTPAIVKKPGVIGEVKRALVGEDIRTTAHYVLYDVIIPSAKNMFLESITQGFERALFGSTTTRSRSTGGHTPYNRMSFSSGTSRMGDGGRDLSHHDRANHNFDSITLQSRAEAEEVLDRLTTYVEEYGHARVTDFYEMVGISGSFTDDDWGWLTLRDAGIKRNRDGFLIILPRPVSIK